MARRFEYSQRFRDGVAACPPEVLQTLADLLAILQADPDDARLGTTDAKAFGLQHRARIACLDNVLVTFALPADYPVILLLSLAWIG